MTRALALELAPKVRVNCIAPGLVKTDAYDHIADDEREAMYASVAASTPVGRVGEVKDIVRAALMVMTNTYMTGTVIDIDGGYLVRS